MATSSIVAANALRARLTALGAGECVVGTMVAELRQTSVPTLLRNGGFDFFILDNEHGSFSCETVADMCRAARAVALTPIVRPVELSYAQLAQSLDGGAQGLLLPRIVHVDEVHRALSMVRYPPLGERGCAQARGWTAFRAQPDVAAAMRDANAQNLLLVQVETAEAARPSTLAALAALDGVDGLFIGPNDLSIALGVPGEQNHARVRGVIEDTIAACRAAGKVPCIHMNDAALAAQWARDGMQLVSCNADVGMLTQAAAAIVKTVHGRD